MPATHEEEVLFCSTQFPRSQELLRERLKDTGLRVVVADPRRLLEPQAATASAIIPASASITASVIAAAPRLRVIVQFGAGLDSVDREAAAARGIAVKNVPGANAQAVAEMATFLMLALARRLPLHRVSFEKRVVGDPPGTELAGKTLGIVGLGASGRALARIGKGFGMDVIAVRRESAIGDLDASWVGGRGDLDALLARADYVSLHLPLTPETRGLIDAQRLWRMKSSAFLVNVGRGGLVVQQALIDALRLGRIAGAGLDVFWEEPPDPKDPLFGLPNLVATPHLGGVTHEALGRIADNVVAILREFVLEGD